jgi:hypothetical protein
MVVPCLHEILDNCAVNDEKRKSVIRGLSVVCVMYTCKCITHHYIQKNISNLEIQPLGRLTQMQQSLNFL